MMATVMGKKKTEPSEGPKPQPRRVRSAATNIRSTPEWKEWLLRFSAHVRKDVADAVDEGMMRYARAEGFESPPKR
jgi:hypothetical protein